MIEKAVLGEETHGGRRGSLSKASLQPPPLGVAGQLSTMRGSSTLGYLRRPMAGALLRWWRQGRQRRSLGCLHDLRRKSRETQVDVKFRTFDGQKNDDK